MFFDPYNRSHVERDLDSPHLSYLPGSKVRVSWLPSFSR